MLAAGRDDSVVTQGDPDWNTICGDFRLAPPERDFRRLRTPDRRPLSSKLCVLRWVLSEVAECANRRSQPHGQSADDERRRHELAQYLT